MSPTGDRGEYTRQDAFPHKKITSPFPALAPSARQFRAPRLVHKKTARPHHQARSPVPPPSAYPISPGTRGTSPRSRQRGVKEGQTPFPLAVGGGGLPRG